MDVDASNFGPYLGPFGGATEPLGVNAIVFDEDGSIFNLLFGVGTTILGFAGPTFMSDGLFEVPIGNTVLPDSEIIEGAAFLNGIFIDGINDPGSGNFEMSQARFEAVFIHEFGHFSGLDHTQIHGLSQAPESDLPTLTRPIETMFPFAVEPAQATLERDDVVAISALYPSASFLSSTGQITGHIRTAAGTPFSGANVIARNVDDDSDAVSRVSGATITPAGFFRLAGLTPGASYRIEVQEVDVFFTGGSRVGPFSPPRILPGPPEFYNGSDEGADPSTDDAEAFTPVSVAPGASIAGVDITLNAQLFSPSNFVTAQNLQVREFAIADFDLDGAPDFVAAASEAFATSGPYFYRGLGDGSFAVPIKVDGFPTPENVVAGHLNPDVDAFPDFAITEFDSDAGVRVYLGDGAGGFALASTIPLVPGRFAADLVLGEMNGDAYDDLVVLDRQIGSDANVTALLGDGAGGFSAVSTAVPEGAGLVPAVLAIGNFAGSAANDLVGVSSSSPATIGLLIGDGTGAFTPLSVPIPGISNRLAGGMAAAVGDFDGSGTADLAVSDLLPVGGPANFTRSWVDILLGDGTGAFALSSRLQVSESFQGSLVAADFNGDSHLDVASAGFGLSPGNPGAKVTLAFGDGAGGMSEPRAVWGLAEFPFVLGSADFDGDAREDLLVSDSAFDVSGLVKARYMSVLVQNTCDAASECDDGNPCTDDVCDGAGLCEQRNNTSPCNDGDPLTGGDVCTDGACVGALPEPPATDAFLFYRVRRAAGQSRFDGVEVQLSDALEDRRARVARPAALGLPASVEFGEVGGSGDAPDELPPAAGWR